MNYPPKRNGSEETRFERGGPRPGDRDAGTEARPPAPPPAGWDRRCEAVHGEPGSHGVHGRYPLAEWGHRAVARLIDWAVVAVPAAIAASLVGFLWVGAQAVIAGYGSGMMGRNFWLIFSVCCFVVFVGYDTVSVKKWRGTVGKRVMRLEVAPLSGAGYRGPIPVASMMARAALFNLVFLFTWNGGVLVFVWLLFVVFVVLWPLWDGPNRQGMHDKLAGTVVVRTG